MALPAGVGTIPGDLGFFGHWEAAGDGKILRVTHVVIADEFGGCISADGATSSIKSLAVAMANPGNRVRRHNTLKYRKDCPYVAARRFISLDALDRVSR
jgi:hypothetical protein